VSGVSKCQIPRAASSRAAQDTSVPRPETRSLSSIGILAAAELLPTVFFCVFFDFVIDNTAWTICNPVNEKIRIIGPEFLRKPNDHINPMHAFGRNKNFAKGQDSDFGVQNESLADT